MTSPTTLQLIYFKTSLQYMTNKHYMPHSIGDMTMKKNERYRITIDLEPYQDVKEMLEAAMEATGNTATTLLVGALKAKLPEIVQELQEQRTRATAAFISKFPSASQVRAKRMLALIDGLPKTKAEDRKEAQNRAQVNKLPNSSAFLELSAQAEKDAISGLAALVNAQKPPLSPASKPKFPGRSRAADKKGL